MWGNTEAIWAYDLLDIFTYDKNFELFTTHTQTHTQAINRGYFPCLWTNSTTACL